MNSRFWIALAGILGALSVGLGAFHAHGLEKRLVALGLEDDLGQRMDWFGTGVRYLMMHTLAVLCLGILVRTQARSVWAGVAGALFIVGLALFCGSLIGLCFSLHEGLAHVAPFGGGALILAWIALGCAGVFSRDAADD